VELDRARAHIAAQTTQIQVIVAQAAEAIYVCDADGLLILANLPAARMFGLTTPEQMRRHVTDLATLVDISTPDGVRLGPRDLFLHRALTERRVIRGEYIIRNPRTGEESVRRVSAAPLVDAGGAPRGAVAVASDISALVELQRLAEIEVEAAKQQRQQLQAILDGLADPVCVFDAAWRVLLANQRLTQTLGLPPDIVGRHATELDDLVPGRFVQMEATERMTSLEERMRADAVDEVTVGDPPRIFRRAASGVYDAAGLPSAYIFLYHDITPLREVERLKDEFLATVSHDLRSPLHHIKGYASTLLRQDIEWEAATQRRFLRIIDRECDRMTRIVVNLLDLARLEDAAAAWLHRTRCELAGIVRVAVERSHPATETHPVQVDLAPDLPPILGDARWLEQVVANLLDNAAKYSPEGAPISVSLHPAEQGQLLTVADRGIGIAPEHLTAIFGRFYRAPAQRRVRGSGLGLAICHRIVTAHGGRIWAESEVELGSRFFVWLPTGGDS
jgi:PAS domain S-box-containing protein